MTRVSGWRRLGNGLGLVVLLAIGWVVSQSTPSEEVWAGPIEVSGEVGESLAGRNIEAVVSEVRIAEEVVASTGWTGTTTGVWVVVDASASAVVQEFGTTLGTAELVVDGTTYSASTRPDTETLAKKGLTVGVPLTGPLMFEVPRELVTSQLAQNSHILLAVNSDPRSDSLIVVEVDLTALPIMPSVETGELVWGAQ
jgi:hypothetical protein